VFRFIVGALFGCLLATVGSGLAADIVGTGTLNGWTVLDDEGDKVCSSPEVWGPAAGATLNTITARNGEEKVPRIGCGRRCLGGE
jgi:hypothetical protein